MADESDFGPALDAEDPGDIVPQDIRQSDTMTVAKQLLGDELADRYGDVLGGRGYEKRDFGRDFLMSAAYGGQGAEEVRQRVRKTYDTAYARELEAAQQQDQENRLRVDSVVKTMRDVKNIPKQHRKAFLKSAFERLGFSSDKFAIQVMADPEAFATENLYSPEMLQLANDKPEDFLARAEEIIGDGTKAAALLSSLQQAKLNRKHGQKLVLDLSRQRAKAREERKTRRLRRRGLELRVRRQEQVIEKGDQPKGLTGIPEIDAELSGAAAPSAAGGDVSAAKKRLGLP